MTTLWNSLPQDVRRVASGYTEFQGTEIFCGTREEALAAAKKLGNSTNRTTAYAPIVLVEFPNGQKLILSVPISNHEHADVIYDVCVKSNVFKNVQLVWEAFFIG